MSALPWWAWIIAAGALGLAELHAPGSYLMWIALGCAVTAALDAGLGLSLEAQIGVVAAASALSCLLGYFVYRRWQPRAHGAAPLNQRDRAMVGERGTVCEAFLSGRGKVRLGDGVWLAEGPDLAEGTAIVVSAVRGTRLVVQALEAKS